MGRLVVLRPGRGLSDKGWGKGASVSICEAEVGAEAGFPSATPSGRAGAAAGASAKLLLL